MLSQDVNDEGCEEKVVIKPQEITQRNEDSLFSETKLSMGYTISAKPASTPFHNHHMLLTPRHLQPIPSLSDGLTDEELTIRLTHAIARNQLH